MNKILPNNQDNLKGITVTGVSQSFSGPLPHPEILRKFDYGSKTRSEERKGKISKEE